MIASITSLGFCETAPLITYESSAPIASVEQFNNPPSVALICDEVTVATSAAPSAQAAAATTTCYKGMLSPCGGTAESPGICPSDCKFTSDEVSGCTCSSADEIVGTCIVNPDAVKRCEDQNKATHIPQDCKKDGIMGSSCCKKPKKCKFDKQEYHFENAGFTNRFCSGNTFTLLLKYKSYHMCLWACT